MASDRDESAPSFEALDREQLEVYAKEAHQHFLEEHRLREEMEENNRQLEVYAKELRQHFLEERRLRQETELRVREISALNQLFQRHLSEEFDVVQSYQQMLETLKTLSTEMHALVARAESVQLPEAIDTSEPAPDGG